ncbi:MAG: c-type cytochrome [Arenicellales bacterium]|nr:c-type cytochrome [Arenicellales bacterium]
MFKRLISRTALLVIASTLPLVAPADEELAKKSNCLACHKVDTKLVGPSYKEIAAKYDASDAATVDMLVEKVTKGGVGTWGQIPMPPNPLVSQEDAKTLVEWVLSQ